MADKEGSLKPWQQLLAPGANQRLHGQLQAQLAKDLGVEIALDQWQTQLAEVLKRLALENQLSATLYRIDLAESEYAAAMQNDEPWMRLAWVVMEREARKVLFRHTNN